jgi:hypothetical protein
MWHWSVTTRPVTIDQYVHTMLDEQICIDCAMDLVKFRSEVLAKKNVK